VTLGIICVFWSRLGHLNFRPLRSQQVASFGKPKFDYNAFENVPLFYPGIVAKWWLATQLLGLPVSAERDLTGTWVQ
jgi:hypothetical protein